MVMSNDRMQIRGPEPESPITPQSYYAVQETDVAFGANNVNVRALNFMTQQYTNMVQSGLKLGERLLELRLEKKRMKKKEELEKQKNAEDLFADGAFKLGDVKEMVDTQSPFGVNAPRSIWSFSYFTGDSD